MPGARHLAGRRSTGSIKRERARVAGGRAGGGTARDDLSVRSGAWLAHISGPLSFCLRRKTDDLSTENEGNERSSRFTQRRDWSRGPERHDGSSGANCGHVTGADSGFQGPPLQTGDGAGPFGRRSAAVCFWQLYYVAWESFCVFRTFSV
jgi:hypothetical protein